jgi:hypothetical protein
VLSGGSGGLLGGNGGSGGINVCATCPSHETGFGELPGCCATASCGVSIDDAVGAMLGVPAGCYATDPGGGTAPDILCPAVVFTDPGLEPAFHPGCCDFISGKCGIEVYLAPAGPYLGCVSTGGGAKGCGSSSECGQCLQNSCKPDINSCTIFPDCLALLDCAVNCADEACVSDCVAAHPDGSPHFEEVQECSAAHCSYFCGIE